MLLARALATPGHPTNRLAQVLDTLAPDDERKRRVLTLAKRLISERDFGSKRPIDDIRQSLDELLLQVRRDDLRVDGLPRVDGPGRRRAPPTWPRAACRRKWTTGSTRSGTRACAGCRASC